MASPRGVPETREPENWSFWPKQHLHWPNQAIWPFGNTELLTCPNISQTGLLQSVFQTQAWTNDQAQRDPISPTAHEIDPNSCCHVCSLYNTQQLCHLQFTHLSRYTKLYAKLQSGTWLAMEEGVQKCMCPTVIGGEERRRPILPIPSLSCSETQL